MKILKIRFNHLNSLSTSDPRGFTIDLSESPFRESGIFAITGLNGAGKSTILDAITMALYRRSARFGDERNPEKMISYGQKECWAEVILEKNNQVYEFRSELQINKKGECKSNVRINSISEQKIITEAINPFLKAVEHEYVGLNYDQFLKTILLAQGNFTAFLDALPKEKAEILSKITNGEIYKLLSIRSHELNNEKKQLVSNLKREYESIQVLSETEEAVKKNRIIDIEKNNQLLNQEADRLVKEIQWLRNVADAWRNLNEKKNKHEIARKNLSDFQPDLERLKQHEKAYEINHLLMAWEGLQKELFSSNVSLEEKEKQLLSIQVKRKEAEQKCTDAFTHNQSIKQQWSEFEPKLIEARKFEPLIAENENRLDVLRKKLKETNQSKQITETEHKNIAKELEEQAKKLELLNKYLHGNTINKQLIQELSGIREVEKQFRKERQDLHNLENEIKINLNEQGFSVRDECFSADLNQKSLKIKTDLQELKNNSQKILSDKTEDTWQKSIEVLRSEIQKVEAISRLISNADDERNAQIQLRNQLQTLEHNYNEIIAERNSLNKTLSLAEQEYNRLQDRLQWEKATASLTEQRKSLMAGQPCPLCGSIHHPYVESNELTYVSETDDSLEKTQNQLKIIRDRLNEVTKNEGEINGKIQQLKESMMQSESKLKQFINQIEQSCIGINVSIQTVEDCQKYWVQLNDKFDAQQKTYELYQNHQKKIQALTEELMNLRTLIDLQTRWEELNSKHASTIASLNQMLSPYGVDLNNLHHTETWLKILEQRAYEYIDAENESKSVEKLIHEQEKMLHSKNAELNQFAQDIARITQEGKQIKEQTDEYKRNKLELIGERSCQEIEEEWKKRLSEAEQLCKQAEKTFQEINSDFDRKTAEYETLKNNFNQLNSRFAEADKALQKALHQMAIPDVPTLKSYYLSSNEVVIIRERHEKLVQEVKICESAVQEATEKWVQLNNQELSTESQEQLEQRLIDIKANIEHNQQELGTLRAELNMDAENKIRRAEKYQQYDQALTEHKRWEQLNSLIGSHDGKKFQLFAQKLTLKQLVEAANFHLVQLSNRYRIIAREDVRIDDLELEIEDLTQASNRRPTKGLSGGEKFLISLALALGLSDLAGSKARIENLFIDEGFGTLDAYNLELALSVLDSLQSQGKMIGIISHIPSLNDRIPARIHVQRQGNGFSKILVE
jgi:exonuclease SbcC